MGTYATTSSYDVILVGTTLDTATTSVISKCITWAENEINKKLAKRYDVSAWSTAALTPPMVTSMCEQLALGYFYDNNSRGGKEGGARADRLIKRVMANLDELAMGKLELVNSSGSIITARGTAKGVLSSTSDYSATFAEDDPLTWAVDPDKLDDISDGRE